MTTAAPSRILLRSELVNNVLAAGDDWAKVGHGNMLEPGIVKYDAETNPDGSVKRPAITYLLTREAIERGRPTAVGKPIIGKAGGFDHLKVNSKDHAAGKYDGDAIAAYPGEGENAGWERVHFVVREPDTKEAMRNGYQFSCGYVPTEVDETPGIWHNVAYDAVINNLEYTHFAVVPNPRYQGAHIELQNSKGGGIMKDTLKALLRALLPAKDLRELANSMEEDDKKAKKDKAAEDLKNALDTAQTPEEKAAAQKAYDNAIAAADKPGAADDSDKKAAEAERQNKISALRNAADAVEKASGKDKAQEYRNEADKLEKLPIGGGDVPKDPGTATPETPEQAQLREKDALEKKNAEDKAAADAAQAKALEAGGAEAWNAVGPDAFQADDVAAKVLVNAADKKPMPINLQPSEVQEAWGKLYASAGASADERCNSLKAKAKTRVELRNAASVEAKKQADEVAKRDAERKERFNSLRRAAEERGGFNGAYPILGDTMEDKAALGQELYG